MVLRVWQPASLRLFSVCITTIVREDILVTKVHDGDQTWVTVDDMLWLYVSNFFSLPSRL